MHFLDLHIDGFGKFHNFDLSLAEGMNVIYGANEAGKSTIHTFIRAMLYGMTRARGVEAEHDLMARYTPWVHPEVYGGKLRLTDGRCIYRIERSFYQPKNEFLLYNETEERAEKAPEEKLRSLLGGVSEAAFCSTVSVGQLKSRDSDGMHAELSRYIRNMNTSGDISLSVQAALDHLARQKSLLEARLYPEASKEYTSVISRIRKLEEELRNPDPAGGQPAAAQHPAAAKPAAAGTAGNTAASEAHGQEIRDSYITRSREALSREGFTDRSSVETVRRETDELYQSWRDLRERSRTGRNRVIAVIFLALAAASTAAVAVSRSGVFLVFAGFFLILAIAYLIAENRGKRAAKAKEQKLRKLFGKYLGAEEVSDRARNAFDERMDKYLELCGSLEELERRRANEQAGAAGPSVESGEAPKDTPAQNTAPAAAPARESDRAPAAALSKESSALSERRSQEEQWNRRWAADRKIRELEDLRDRAGELRALVESNRRVREDIDALDLAMDTMRELASSMKSSFGYYLNQTASKIIRILTGGAYESLDVDNEMTITLNRRGRFVPIDQTSGGTAEQIWLALRLAAAKIIPAEGTVLPLIFDESFVLYDRQRLSDALSWLAGPDNDGRQVMIFTCRTEELDTLKQNKTRCHKIVLS
jgi:DNA repair exonuclease SbcCD ATPase subunit